MQGDICGTAVVFSPDETEHLFEGTCFTKERFDALMQKKVVALILEHHHGVLPECSSTNMAVEHFSINHEERPHHGDDAIEIIYRIGKGKWRQVFHFVRCAKGGLNGRLYTNTRRFIGQ